MALRLFLLLACTFLLFTSREPPWADSHVVYDTAQALVDHGRLDVRLDGPPQFFAYHNGKKYGVFPLGNVVAMVPSYVAYRALAATRLFPAGPLFALCSHLSPALLMAAAGVVFFRLCRRRGATERWAALLTLSFGFATVSFCYARSAYSEALQTLLVLLLVQGSLRATDGERPTVRQLVWIGLVAGALFNSKLVNALLLPAVPAYLVWRHLDGEALARRGTSRAAALRELAWPFLAGLASFAVLAAVALWHNRLKTGSLLDTGYQIPNGIFSGDLLAGLHGFLLAPGKNIFLYSPPLFLLPFALPTALRRQRPESLFLLAIAGIALVWNAKFRSWHGDYCWGPRHLVPFLPLALLLLVPWLPEAMERGQRRLRRWLLGLLLAAGLFAQLLGACFYWDHYIRMLIAIKDQTGAAGWFQEQLGHAHYMPQFSPLVGHLWLLKHKLRGDENLVHDAPWKLLVPQPFDLRGQYRDLRFDWWLLDFYGPESRRYPLALPLLLGLFVAGLGLGGTGLYRRLRRPD